MHDGAERPEFLKSFSPSNLYTPHPGGSYLINPIPGKDLWGTFSPHEANTGIWNPGINKYFIPLFPDDSFIHTCFLNYIAGSFEHGNYRFVFYLLPQHGSV